MSQKNHKNYSAVISQAESIPIARADWKGYLVKMVSKNGTIGIETSEKKVDCKNEWWNQNQDINSLSLREDMHLLGKIRQPRRDEETGKQDPQVPHPKDSRNSILHSSHREKPFIISSLWKMLHCCTRNKSVWNGPHPPANLPINQSHPNLLKSSWITIFLYERYMQQLEGKAA